MRQRINSFQIESIRLFGQRQQKVWRDSDEMN